MWGKLLLTALAVPAAILLASPAHADRDSFMQYIRGHQINTSVAHPDRVLLFGIQHCEMMRQGVSPEEPSDTISLLDIRGIVDAAQHELCPDTLK